MFTLTFTTLALAPLALAVLATLTTFAVHAFRPVDMLALMLASEPAADMIELSGADVMPVAAPPALPKLRAFVVDGVRVLARSYTEASRVAAA